MALVCFLARLLRSSCSSVPRSLPLFCGVAAQALIRPGPARPDISLLTTGSLVYGPGFLVHSPTLRRLPMGCHGWGFVYVSTF